MSARKGGQMYDKHAGDLVWKYIPPTQEQILERTEEDKEKIREWTHRPPPPKPLKRQTKKAPVMCYYGGRFYDEGKIWRALKVKFKTRSKRQVCLRAYADLHGAVIMKNNRVRAFVEQTLKDYENGAKLPSFLAEVFLQ
jgi:hypothetical protein